MEQEEFKKPKNVVTIRDEALLPYEIDVDKRGYDVMHVRQAVSKEGRKPIFDPETGKPVMRRVFVGQWPSIGQAIGAIVKMRTRDYAPDLSGKVVTLREYMNEYATYVKKMAAFWEYFTQHDEVDESLFKIKRDDVNRIFTITRK